ncbi:hypothetical protein CDD83_3944 [Cordyceps sp. RAO-2017]|nr:hypothetical protein CDD83_3944 [Cordyceps sp. RAO-2017]
MIETTAESVRVKLDLVYLEALVAAERSGRAKPATQDEVQALQQEVESLYSEILPVAQMSVEKQHLELAVDSISAKAGNSLRRTTDALEYINDCLDYLLDRMKSLRTRIETHQSHEVATAQIASSVRSEIGTSVTPPPRPSRPISSASPLRRSSPVRLAGRHGRSGSSSGQDDAPLEVLLRNLAVSIPPDARDGRKKVEFLARTVAERSLKADEVARAAHESFEASVTSQLRDAKLAIQLVRDSVLADSPFGDIKLSDPEIEASILVLDQEVEKARERLSTIERQKMPIRSVKREEIMQRFGPAKPF